jgi:hypothetical protein
LRGENVVCEDGGTSRNIDKILGRFFMMRSALLGLIISCHSLFGGSLQESKDPDNRQKVNFCGVLRSANMPNQPRMIENIGMPSYTKIKFYRKPATPDADPGEDVWPAQLKDILKIERQAIPIDPAALAKLTDKQKEKITDEFPEFRGRRYVDLQITLNDPEQTKVSYIVEANRRIHYDEIVDGKVLSGLRIDFKRLESLEIKGHFERSEDKKNEGDNKRCAMILKGQTPPETPEKK